VPEVLRSQPRCYYLTQAHADSFWGKYFYLYEGRGNLILTAHSLLLMGTAPDFEIPLDSIKGVQIGTFSRVSKPFPLARLTVDYVQDEEVHRVYLIPHESAFDPTWETSKLVASWLETLRGVEGLAGRVGPPLEGSLVGRPSRAKFARMAMPIALIALASFFLAMTLILVMA